MTLLSPPSASCRLVGPALRCAVLGSKTIPRPTVSVLVESLSKRSDNPLETLETAHSHPSRPGHCLQGVLLCFFLVWSHGGLLFWLELGSGHCPVQTGDLLAPGSPPEGFLALSLSWADGNLPPKDWLPEHFPCPRLGVRHLFVNPQLPEEVVILSSLQRREVKLTGRWNDFPRFYHVPCHMCS